MPTFSYTARDGAGNVSSGTVEAETNSGAVATLREQGLWVTDLRAQGARRPSGAPGAGDQSILKGMFSPVSQKDLSLFYRQLFTLLNAGTPVYGSLEMLSQQNQTPNRHLREVVAVMAKRALEGRPLSESMARYPWLFDRMQVRMVEAGEHGGMLVEVLRRLAGYCEQAYELNLTIKRKTLYPKILLGALFIIPQIPALVLGGFGPFLAGVWGSVRVVALFFIPTFLAFRFALTTQGFRNFYDQVKLMIPLIGPLVRKLAMARFARTLAALYSSGVSIASATALAGETSGNNVLERHSARMVPAMERGMPLSQTMLASGFFPGMFVGMVQTGETSGNLDEILNKAADFYEEEALHATIQLTVVLGVLLLLIMAVIIAIRIIGFYTGYFQGVFQGAGGGE